MDYEFAGWVVLFLVWLILAVVISWRGWRERVKSHQH